VSVPQHGRRATMIRSASSSGRPGEKPGHRIDHQLFDDLALPAQLQLLLLDAHLHLAQPETGDTGKLDLLDNDGQPGQYGDQHEYQQSGFDIDVEHDHRGQNGEGDGGDHDLGDAVAAALCLVGMVRLFHVEFLPTAVVSSADGRRDTYLGS